MTDPNGLADAGNDGFHPCRHGRCADRARLRNELSLWLRAHFVLDAARLNDVLLAANEALTNAAEFAYPGQRGTMTMQARYDAADATLSVDVSDCGTWRQTDPKAQSNTRGRGIPLMHALADRATISPLPTGTWVQLRSAMSRPSVRSRAGRARDRRVRSHPYWLTHPPLSPWPASNTLGRECFSAAIRIATVESRFGTKGFCDGGGVEAWRQQ